ncbi:MAG: hypothetical protein WBP85_14510 [Terracidiphilus sp.]
MSTAEATFPSSTNEQHEKHLAEQSGSAQDSVVCGPVDCDPADRSGDCVASQAKEEW